MKKLFCSFIILSVFFPCVYAEPSHITKDGNGGYIVTYNYKDKAKKGWYVTGRAELSFLNWKNNYSSDYPLIEEEFNSDEYSFEPVFGGSLSIGRTFNYFWRAELEAGYIGQYTDKDAGFEFSMSVPYVMLNGYYDFINGIYVGVGVGAAMPITKLDGEVFISGDRTETGFSPMGSVMLGYTYKLDDNLVLDLRYRLSGFNGTDQIRNFQYVNDGDTTIYEAYLENDIGFVLDNSISLGIRYEF